MQKIRLKIIILFLMIALFNRNAIGQELNARVKVIALKVNQNIPRSTFTTLEKSLNNFLNNRKWTSINYTTTEKIDCVFQLTLDQTERPNEYNAKLNIQAARPVYNTNYISPTVNYVDNDITFKYIEFQQIEFNENRVAGSEGIIANLPAVLAYYAYMIIGIDQSSFSLKGGESTFLKAQNIVNNAPQSATIKGWRNIDGIRNRYWLTENFLNSRYSLMFDIYYNYYRLVLDKMQEDENTARQELLNVLNLMQSFVNDNLNTFIAPFFFFGKANEIIKILQKATTEQKQRASELLQKVDITNANRYKEELK